MNDIGASRAASGVVRSPITWTGFRRGVKQAQPLAAGVFVYGIVFGLLARQVGLPLMESVAMSVFVYSGSAQLAAVTAIASGTATWATLALGIIVINARYVLFSAALQPWLRAAPPWAAYASLFFLGDGNWMLSMNAHAQGERDTGFVLGSGIAMFLPWVGGTVIGILGATFVPSPRTLGLDFLLASFAAAMLAGLVKTRFDLVPAIVGAGTALAVHQIASFGWSIVAAGLAGAIAAGARSRSERSA